MQTLMYWKIIFDRCYCINSAKYLLKFGKNMTLYFVTVWQSTRGISFFFKYPSSWCKSIKRFKMAFIIRFDLDVSEMTSWLLYNCRREVQNEVKFHQQKRRYAYLYAIISMQNEPYPFLCQSAVLDRRKLAACFFFTYFTLNLAC